MDKTKKTKPEQAGDLAHHYNTTQLRQDTWNKLKITAAHLYEKSLKDEDLSQPIGTIKQCFKLLTPIEHYWAFPGKATVEQLLNIFRRKEYFLFVRAVSFVVRTIISESYREHLVPVQFSVGDLFRNNQNKPRPPAQKNQNQKYFEVLVVDNLEPTEEITLRTRMRDQQSQDDGFIYDIVVAPSFEDALLAVILNPNIQSVVIRYGFPVESSLPSDILRPHFSELEERKIKEKIGVARSLALGSYLHKLRPELDLFLVTDASVEEAMIKGTKHFRRIFYRNEDYLELYLSICKGINDRFSTPFFHALTAYSKRPTGVFHAMPVSRGNSIYKTHWIRDMGDFYGKNIFLAETSATTGGLDSLLNPTGPIKQAQEYAARAFGSMHTYFVTNGTSTANKIVQLGLLKPGDIVLIDRDCHKSHHYGLTLSGANPAYLDSYPLTPYSMYGAVPLSTIKETLLKYKEEGLLDRVRMVILTNSTFDGLIYDPKTVMREILAIKPDMIFLWDEAWFGFAYFHHMYRQRTAMAAANELSDTFRSQAYRDDYEAKAKNGKKLQPMPDPDKVRIRVYATHSTHKTLSSLRQGSMIHIFDECFQTRAERCFNEAYMTHTSTSPNYQILASLDVARRQAELEGYELVQKSIEMAMVVRETIKTHPLLSRYFSCLTPGDLIPDRFRPSGFRYFYDEEKGWASGERAWQEDQFVLDPTRITLYIGKTGIDGDTFRKNYLMDQFGIQVNKTTRNTVLFMTNIGTNRSSTAFLISVLIKIAQSLEKQHIDLTRERLRALENRVHSLTQELPPLPDFSAFHTYFRPHEKTPEGDLRNAFFLAYESDNCEYASLGPQLIQEIENGRVAVSASFVTPYPPGFPVLVPGQVISRHILDFLLALDVKEIHGYNPDLGLRIFKKEVIEKGQLQPNKTEASLDDSKDKQPRTQRTHLKKVAAK